MLRLLVLSAIYPQIANQVGWMSAEMGRYPWIVYNYLRISEGLSKVVTANQIIGSLILFTIVYIFLFILFIYLLNEKFTHGPEEINSLHTPYPQQYIAVKSATNGKSTG
jgi:cytochrome d ubiquinol oxidase subunit I